MSRYPMFLLIPIALFAIDAHAQAPMPAFDRIVPADVILYQEGDSSAAARREFTYFNQAMEDLAGTMDDILEWRVAMDEWRHLAEEAGIDESVEALARSRWCFAVTSAGDKLDRLPMAIYIASLDDPEAADAFLGGLLQAIASMTPVLETESDFYDGLTIQSLFGPGRIPGLGLSYAIYRDHLFMASSKPLVIDLIERSDTPFESLADSPAYQEAIALLPAERSGLCYWPIHGLGETAEGFEGLFRAFLLSQGKDSDNDEAKMAINVFQTASGILKALKANVSSSHIDSEGVETTTNILQLNRDALDPAIAAMLEREPQAFAWGDLLPRQTGSFTYWNQIHMKDAWQLIQKHLDLLPPVKQQADAAMKWLAEQDIDLERDVFSWMGDSSLMIRPIVDLNAVAPTNHAALVIEVIDRERLDASLKGIQGIFEGVMKQFQIPFGVETDNYRGVSVSTVGAQIPFLPLSPSWCIIDDRFILSSEKGLIHEIIDTQQGRKPGLARNPNYAELSGMIEEPANKLAFQDIAAEFFAHRESLLRLASLTQMSPDADSDEIRQTQAVIDRAAYLLGCLQIYRASVKHSEFTPDMLKSEKRVLARDLRAAPSTESIKRTPITLGGAPFIEWWARQSAKQGDADRAIRLYEQLLRHAPGDGPVLSALAALYSQAGDPGRAIEVYNQALIAAPSTALMIEREASLPAASVSESVERILQTSAASPGVSAEAALFGAALRIRDAQRAQGYAAALAERFPRSPFTLAIADEFMDGGSATGLANTPIVIDGSMDEAGWDGAPAMSFDAQGALVKVLHDDERLYAGFILPGMADEETVGMVEVKWMMDPERSYTKRLEFRLAIEPQAGEPTIVRQEAEAIVDDPYDLRLDEAAPEQSADALAIVRSVLSDITDEDFGFLDFGDENTPKPIVWQAKAGTEGNTMVIELAVNRDELPEGWNTDNIAWLMSGEVKATSSEGLTSTWYADGASRVNDYLNYSSIHASN